MVTPARRFIANRYGLGYQIPLGLVCLGGPLLDAGYSVRLIDNDLHGWSCDRLAHEISRWGADHALIGHTGSTAAHPCCVETMRAIRRVLPGIKIVYGGVFPSYAHEVILHETPEIDVIVRGEGEQTILDLVAAWASDQPLDNVPGITWRKGGEIVVNRSPSPIQNLDQYRPGWELLDWSGYRLFGLAPAAGLQFSRGCPLACTYCGQWLYWRKWRHRSPENVVENLRTLRGKYGVKFVWFGDENFSADRETARTLLQMIVDAKLDLSLNLNMTAADIVRDADLMPLYKAAGVDYIVTGVESLDDGVIHNIHKNNPFSVSRQAVQVMRDNNIVSLVNIIYGLEAESWRTVWQKFERLLELDPDILNAEYLTPHFWTSDGNATRPAEIIQTDLSKWTYRNQVIATPSMTPPTLFLAVKLTEILFHVRPRALFRPFFNPDARYRQIMRDSLLTGMRVLWGEVLEFLFDTTFSPRGSLK